MLSYKLCNMVPVKKRHKNRATYTAMRDQTHSQANTTTTGTLTTKITANKMTRRSTYNVSAWLKQIRSKQPAVIFLVHVNDASFNYQDSMRYKAIIQWDTKRTGTKKQGLRNCDVLMTITTDGAQSNAFHRRHVSTAQLNTSSKK